MTHKTANNHLYVKSVCRLCGLSEVASSYYGWDCRLSKGGAISLVTCSYCHMDNRLRRLPREGEMIRCGVCRMPLFDSRSEESAKRTSASRQERPSRGNVKPSSEEGLPSFLKGILSIFRKETDAERWQKKKQRVKEAGVKSQADLDYSIRQERLNEMLRGFSIADARLIGIGPKRCGELAKLGFRNASDIHNTLFKKTFLQGAHGIGEQSSAVLCAWADDLARECGKRVDAIPIDRSSEEYKAELQRLKRELLGVKPRSGCGC
jgi:hypothetical protein